MNCMVVTPKTLIYNRDFRELSYDLKYQFENNSYNLSNEKGGLHHIPEQGKCIES